MEGVTAADIMQLPAFAAAAFFYHRWREAEKKLDERLEKERDFWKEIAMKGVNNDPAG